MPAEETKKRALRMLEKRDYSTGELQNKLVLTGKSPEDARAAVGHLADLGLINDSNYAALVVRHYAAKGFGRARIMEELRHRFVPRELWDEALEALPGQDETLDALLRARLKSAEPDRAELKRASDALRRRGFGWDEISRAVERYNSGGDTEL